jgi:hypothetical protein
MFYQLHGHDPVLDAIVIRVQIGDVWIHVIQPRLVLIVWMRWLIRFVAQLNHDHAHRLTVRYI